jgi:hypothetical protein
VLPLAGLLVGAAGISAAPAQDDDAVKEKGWFTDVAAEVGLNGQRAKECVFTDLNGDGWWDLVLRRRTVYLSKRRGGKFKLVEDHGIEQPEVETIPVADDGKLQRKKAKMGPFVPHYLYFADVDNDGDQDALWGVKSSWEWFDGKTFRTAAEADHGLRSRVYLNDGDGRFTRGPDSGYTAKDAAGAVMALAIVDVDRDGSLDLFEGREYRRYGVLYGCGVDRLWMGDGRGGFTDGTEAAGLMTVPEPALATSSRPTYGVTHADVDNDGDQDLLALSYGRQWNRQWRNEGDGTFVEVGRETMFAGDAIQHGRYPEWLHEVYRKRGQTRRDEAPFRSNGNTFDCAVGDVDNDGDLDLLLGEITHAWAGESSDLSALLVNQRWAFERKTVDALLPARARRDDRNWNNGDLHTAMADFDNDGRMDLVIASGDYPDGQFLRIYHQQPDGSFVDVTKRMGVTWEGCGSLSLGDFDRDGDVDILMGRSFMRLNKAHRDQHMGGMEVNQVGLLRNDVANRSGNHWLNVRLVGTKANRSGIGARIEVTAGKKKWIREIRCGAGLANHQDPPEACFGLGKHDRIDRLVVRWPDAAGTVEVHADLPADRFVVVTQGAEKPALSKD